MSNIRIGSQIIREASIILERDRVAHHRRRVAAGVRAVVHRHIGERVVADAVVVHVAPHPAPRRARPNGPSAWRSRCRRCRRRRRRTSGSPRAERIGRGRARHAGLAHIGLHHQHRVADAREHRRARHRRRPSPASRSSPQVSRSMPSAPCSDEEAGLPLRQRSHARAADAVDLLPVDAGVADGGDRGLEAEREMRGCRSRP